MRLHYLAKEGKRFIGKTWFVSSIIASVFGSYGLGFLSASETLKTPVYVEKYVESTDYTDDIENKHILASRSGTKVYYVWCGGSKRIKEENRVYFQSVKDALDKGYEPAKNCPGM